MKPKLPLKSAFPNPQFANGVNKSIRVALLWLVLILSAALSRAAEDKVRKAIERKSVTEELLKSLTYADVPEDWKAKKELDKKVTPLTKVIYSRDGFRRLEVHWADIWKGPMEKNFVARLFHPDKRFDRLLATIMRVDDSIRVICQDVPKDYSLETSIKDNGVMTVTVMTNDNAFYERVIVKGRDTHLLDDLEYTKWALEIEAIKAIPKPDMDALRQELRDDLRRKQGLKPK